ncbi:MAG: DUF3501 family protein [Acidimicrobiales bacterium]
MAKLTLDDIVDVRAYERERDDFRRRVIALKKRRRVLVGPIMSFVFENRETIRFQIQEMARVERLLSDEAVEIELRTYNPLIPDPGELCATMLIELTSDEQQRHWKPLLVGLLDRICLRVGAGDRTLALGARIEDSHAQMLTRDVPPSVNFVRWRLGPEAVAAFACGPVTLVIDHESYRHETTLADATVDELLRDLRGS